MIYVLYFEQKVFAENSAEATSAYALQFSPANDRTKTQKKDSWLISVLSHQIQENAGSVFSENGEGSCFGREGETWGLLDLQQGPILGGPRDPPVKWGGLLVKDTKEVR